MLASITITVKASRISIDLMMTDSEKTKKNVNSLKILEGTDFTTLTKY